MSYPMTQIGGRAHHAANEDAEKHYDELRDKARQEADKRGDCLGRSRQAYESGNGALAHQLSDEGKSHGAKMAAFNKQASDYIFRENNAHQPDDTIDLHGQFVEEAENILEARIRDARARNQTHLHVIVGKGIHSVNHVQKIKPRVEQICQELGLQYATEENEGRMYINLQGGAAVMPPKSSWGAGGQQGNHGGQHQQQGSYQQGSYAGAAQQGVYPGAPQHQPGNYQQQQQQGNNGDNDELEKLAMKLLPRILKKLDGCCVVM